MLHSGYKESFVIRIHYPPKSRCMLCTDSHLFYAVELFLEYLIIDESVQE